MSPSESDREFGYSFKADKYRLFWVQLHDTYGFLCSICKSISMFVQLQDQEDQENQCNSRSLESASVPCNLCFFARIHAPLLMLLLFSLLYRITKDNFVRM